MSTCSALFVYDWRVDTLTLVDRRISCSLVCVCVCVCVCVSVCLSVCLCRRDWYHCGYGYAWHGISSGGLVTRIPIFWFYYTESYYFVSLLQLFLFYFFLSQSPSVAKQVPNLIYITWHIMFLCMYFASWWIPEVFCTLISIERPCRACLSRSAKYVIWTHWRPKFVWIVYQKSVYVLQKTNSSAIMKTGKLILYREIIAVFR